MRIRLFDETPAEAASWDAYVLSQPQATNDHLWAWRRILSGAFGFNPYYLGALEGERLVGLLPLFQIPRGWGRSALSSIPFGNYGGLCADSDDAARALLGEAKALLGALGGRYLDLRHRWPFADGGLREQSLYRRFTLPLLSDPALHLQQMGQNNRKKISRAKRRGLRVVVSRDARQLYPIHAQTARRLGTPCFPRRYFELILEQFGPQAEGQLVACEDRLVAYNLVLYFKDSMVIQLGGALERFLHDYPNNLLFWHAIERGCALGLRELDYCRNRVDSGSAHFKRQLHLQEAPLAYQYYLPDGQAIPQRHPSNPKYRAAIALWKQLPLYLTQRLGPPLVRYLA